MTKDPYRYFRLEARELLTGLQAGVLELERGEATGEAVGRLLRLSHTLKGAARVVRLVEVAAAAHAIEDLLAPLRGAAGPAPDEAVSHLLRALDEVSTLLGRLDVDVDVGSQAAAPSAAAAAAAAAASPLPAAPAQAEAAPRAAERRPAERVDAVRVPLAALDGLLDGLLTLRAHVHALGDTLGARAGDELRRLDRGLAALQSDVGELRLVPADVMTTALERVARDAGLTLGRRVALHVRGADVRLDAPVLLAVQEAMVQAVRNAVAHGLEDDVERRARGKAPIGRVDVTIERQGARVLVRCQDDGRGLDLQAIREAAVARGLLDAPRLAALGQEELVDLLLRGGISTARALTQVAGRGVGMDVVREVTDRVSGEVTLESAPGRGTSLTLAVPVSLAALRALTVEAAGEAFLVPLDGVEAGAQAPRAADGQPPRAVPRAGEVVPFAPLAELVGGQARATGAPLTLLHLCARGRRAALGVERLRGVTEVVLRPLPPALGRTALVAGAAVLADGTPMLVLDPAGLVAAAAARGPARAAPAPVRLPLLVIDDSLTTRMLEQTILTAAGYEVDLAASAEEGLELARLRDYGAFIVDVEMPGMDGFEFVARTRADPVLRAVPALLVTSRDAPEDHRRGDEVGASGYIVKGEFEESRLLELVGRVTGPGGA